MSFFDLIETDPWPTLKPKIMAERADRMEALLRVTKEALPQQQGFIEALDWVLEEAKPKIMPRELEDDQG